ncbi:MAG TPA: hypothetical protein VK498_03240 [Ferruginibacter sp.]|nr:hypothetical protein [Ferruginibacter sp.]
MMYIDRLNKSPEQGWLDRADQATKDLLNAATSADRNNIIDANENLWGELKIFLLDISYQKCWYSESKDSYNHLHVDHFRPKKIALGIDKKDHGGYWWLAFQWKNYRVCGGVGNVRKKEKFAVKNNKATDQNSNIEDEMIYFLDPTDEEDTFKITFKNNGEVMPIVSEGWDYERAVYTITNLNLNFKALKEARNVLWIKCSTLVTEIQTLMAENNINYSAFRKGQINEKLKHLKELADKKSAFSATVKACLRSTGVHWAVSYAA